MTKHSNKSYASKFKNTKTFHTYLATMVDYAPPTSSASLEELQANITKADDIMTIVSTKEVTVTNVINERKKLYRKDANSLKKRLTSINQFLEATRPADDIYLLSVKKIIKHIRGESSNKKTEQQKTTTKSISTIENTFGSMWTDLGKLIINLERIGSAYNPANSLITIASLKSLHNTINGINIIVDQNNAEIKIMKADRNMAFKVLDDQLAGIKRLVRSQFGSDSDNFKKLKSLA